MENRLEDLSKIAELIIEKEKHFKKYNKKN